jgi:putative ATP-binding cassette transporter
VAARFYAARNFETIAHAYLRNARYCYLRAIAAPFIVASPGYFFGGLSLGSLMVAVGAFNQVQQALRWFVDNFSTVADWRATLLRVASFRLALVEMDKLGGETGRIELVPTADDRLVFDQIGIASPEVARCSVRSMS